MIAADSPPPSWPSWFEDARKLLRESHLPLVEVPHPRGLEAASSASTAAPLEGFESDSSSAALSSCRAFLEDGAASTAGLSVCASARTITAVDASLVLKESLQRRLDAARFLGRRQAQQCLDLLAQQRALRTAQDEVERLRAEVLKEELAHQARQRRRAREEAQFAETEAKTRRTWQARQLALDAREKELNEFERNMLDEIDDLDKRRQRINDQRRGRQNALEPHSTIVASTSHESLSCHEVDAIQDDNDVRQEVEAREATLYCMEDAWGYSLVNSQSAVFGGRDLDEVPALIRARVVESLTERLWLLGGFGEGTRSGLCASLHKALGIPVSITSCGEAREPDSRSCLAAAISSCCEQRSSGHDTSCITPPAQECTDGDYQDRLPSSSILLGKDETSPCVDWRLVVAAPHLLPSRSEAWIDNNTIVGSPGQTSNARPLIGSVLRSQRCGSMTVGVVPPVVESVLVAPRSVALPLRTPPASYFRPLRDPAASVSLFGASSFGRPQLSLKQQHVA